MRHLLIAALGMLIPAHAMAQSEVVVPDFEIIPAIRPCIDYVGRGALRMNGEADPVEIDGEPTGDVIYNFRFNERTELLGHSDWRNVTLSRSGHALRPFDIADVAIFISHRQGRNRLVAWQWVWRDRSGRPFVPIFSWPNPDARNADWMPLSIRQFARPVTYRDPQPYWPDVRIGRVDFEDAPDLYAMHGRRAHVRYGLYLSDIPEMFSKAREERCWR